MSARPAQNTGGSAHTRGLIAGLRQDADDLRKALEEIALTDPVDAVLDPTRPIRIARHELAKFDPKWQDR